MKVNLVIRDVSSSKQLVEFTRACCAELARHVWPWEHCDVLVQAVRPGGDVIACVVIGDGDPLAVQCSDSCALTAVTRAMMDMLTCLEHARPMFPAEDAAAVPA